MQLQRPDALTPCNSNGQMPCQPLNSNGQKPPTGGAITLSMCTLFCVVRDKSRKQVKLYFSTRHEVTFLTHREIKSSEVTSLARHQHKSSAIHYAAATQVTAHPLRATRTSKVSFLTRREHKYVILLKRHENKLSGIGFCCSFALALTFIRQNVNH